MPEKDELAPAAQPFIAYELYPGSPFGLDPAPYNREWMDKAHLRFPYRCLPLVIANQSGWMLKCPTSFKVYWYGGANKDDVEVRFIGKPDARIISHFGVGTFTFTIPFLFRTPPGINLWVKGPTNWPKDGAQALEGVVETDWLVSTFTMNWKVTRMCEWVTFEEGEPFCQLVPVPRGLLENLVPLRIPITANPDAAEGYKKWEQSRTGFLKGLDTRDPTAVKLGWQKDYFQGKRPDGKGNFEDHQTRLALRPFTHADAVPTAAEMLELPPPPEQPEPGTH